MEKTADVRQSTSSSSSSNRSCRGAIDALHALAEFCFSRRASQDRAGAGRLWPLGGVGGLGQAVVRRCACCSCSRWYVGRVGRLAGTGRCCGAAAAKLAALAGLATALEWRGAVRLWRAPTGAVVGAGFGRTGQACRRRCRTGGCAPW
eukprot:scaffold21649_cov118-Isochrysis_galbana.AAC.2